MWTAPLSPVAGHDLGSPAAAGLRSVLRVSGSRSPMLSISSGNRARIELANRRTARTDSGAARERHRGRCAAGRDRGAAGGRFARRPSRARSRHRAGHPAGRRLSASPTSGPSIRSQRRPRGLRPRGVRRRVDVHLRAAARALHRGAVVHRRGPRGGWDRPAARDHGVRRATGVTQLATGAGAAATARRLAARAGDAHAGDRPGRRRRAARRRRGRRRRRRQDAWQHHSSRPAAGRLGGRVVRGRAARRPPRRRSTHRRRPRGGPRGAHGGTPGPDPSGR